MPTPCWLNPFAPSELWSPCLLSFFLFLSSSFSLYFWLIPWNVKAGCVTQGIVASFLLSLSHLWLWTIRFWSIKGPTASPQRIWLSMQEMHSLVRGDPLEKELATHPSSLAWKIPWIEEPGRLQSIGSERVRHDWVTEHTYYWVYSKHS